MKHSRHEYSAGNGRVDLWRLRAAAVTLCLLALGFCQAQAQALRFAWLSDTHIGSSSAEADLRASVRDINSMSGLSFVVVSGDVTEYGSREQLRLAKQILDGLTVPCHVIPGNHDCKWSESGATDFARIWGQDRFSFEQGGHRFIGMHQGPVMKMGDGHWAPQDVRWLAELLHSMPDTNQPIIFITHYPIDDGIDNWFAVLDLLKTRNTQAVLCGHGHANRAMEFEGLPGIMGRSNLRAKAAAGAFNIVEITSGNLTVSEHTTGGSTKQPWHTVALGNGNYASRTNAYPRPDFSVNARHSDVAELWSLSTGQTVASSPALCKNLVVVGDGSGAVQAWRVKDGSSSWKFSAGGAVYSTPACADGRVFFGCTDGCVYALDSESGKLLWRSQRQRAIVASPLVRKGVVYIGSSEGKFRALDARTGTQVWQFDGLRGFVETRPLYYQGNVIFGAWDEHLYALNSKTGELAWKWRGDKPGTLLSPAACWPVGAEGKIFIVAPDRKMTAIDASTGKGVWRTGELAVRESIGLAENGSRIYVRAMNDLFCALSTSVNAPQKLWETNAHFGYDINSAALVEKDGVVFYGTKNGLLFALDGKTGAIRWEHKLGVSLVNTVLPLSKREVVVTDLDGKIALVEQRR